MFTVNELWTRKAISYNIQVSVAKYFKSKYKSLIYSKEKNTMTFKFKPEMLKLNFKWTDSIIKMLSTIKKETILSDVSNWHKLKLVQLKIVTWRGRNFAVILCFVIKFVNIYNMVLLSFCQTKGKPRN